MAVALQKLSVKPGESPRLGIKRPNTRNSGLPPEAMRARSSRMKDNNSNELNDEQQSCKNSKPLIPKTDVIGTKDDNKDFKSHIPEEEIIKNTTDIDKKEDKEIQTDTNEKPCIYKESATNTDEEGLDSWTKAVGLETLYQVVVREHQDLQRAHQALQAKLKTEQRARLDLESPIKTREENPINLALAAQIEELTARQEELISENHDLREQNDLLEFRILEMDSAPASLHFKTAPASPSRTPESRDDVSDSGVLSLPTSEDISEADFHDLAMEPSSRDIKYKLAQLCLSIENVTDKVSIQQGLSLLRHYEVRLETALNTLSQDALSVRSLTSPDSVISSETSKSQSRIIATVLPFTDLSQNCGKQKDDLPLKKLFKDADCLQESGIFEESPEYCSRCTQTDCSSAKLETTGDLSLEIRKLKQIQERIEEQGSNKRLLRANNTHEANGLSAESKELAFYRDRVEMLENKLAIYESSGDEQAKKMKLRLDREIILSAEIKHLKERCRMLEELSRKLDEEKCEFEEAENDTRLRCQKLEVKLSALGEKKSDLQVQLQQNARTMSNLRSCLAEEERKRIEARQHASRMENLVQHYEQRNFELEEKEIESRCRAQMLEKTIPALQVFNTWKVANAICQSAGRDLSSQESGSNKMIMSSSEVEMSCDGGDNRFKSHSNQEKNFVKNLLVPSYETEIGDQGIKHHESSNRSDCIDQYNDYEEYLQDRIKQLEFAIKCKEELQQQSLSPDQKNSLITKLQELKKTNCDLECRLKDLEMKEGYYKQTLQQADEMWANMEGGYKEQLRELENKLDDKQNEIYEFEAMVRKMSCEKEMRQQLQERTCSLESEMKDYRFKIAEKECERKLLEKERLRLTEELEHTNEEFNYLKHVIEPSLRQQLEEHKKLTKELKREIESLEKDREQEIEDRLAEVSGLKRKMNKLGKELLENECTISELREEVQTLEIAVIELREKLEDVNDKHEREVMKMTMEIDDKSREIQYLQEKSTCEMKLPKSARQELEEAEQQMQSCNSKEPSTSTSTSTTCDQKPPKRHRKHKALFPHPTLKKLNEKIRAGLLKDDKEVLKNSDSQLGGEHLTDYNPKTDSISRIAKNSLLAEMRDSGDRSAIDLRTLPQDVEVHATKCFNVESCYRAAASEHSTSSSSSSSAIELKEDKELHVDGQSTESTPNSNTQLEKQISEMSHL
ncbi:myosin-9 isoform X2 [Nilaparvata lugens]|uniref:myosin-9 isoform X2 n=1 Tax=Nilaparvata lugens TaxID=108931 RepID=UPI00193E3E86|nr:myosin-9 isoform X2 [Nilaparvata lugens]